MKVGLGNLRTAGRELRPGHVTQRMHFGTPRMAMSSASVSITSSLVMLRSTGLLPFPMGKPTTSGGPGSFQEGRHASDGVMTRC
jgi:hypothetical protein